MKWLQELRIGIKLVIGFAIMIVFMMIIGVSGYSGISTIERQLNEIFEVRLPSVNLLLQADRDLQQLVVAERSMIFANAKSDVFKGLIEEYDTNLKQSEERWQKFKALPATAEEKTVSLQYEQAREEWKVISRKIVDGRIADTRQGRRAALDLSLKDAKEKFEEMRTHLDKLQEINLQMAQDAHAASLPVYRQTLLTLFAVTGIGMVAGLFLAFLLSRGIVKPLKRVLNFADLLKAGDLRARLTTGRDEIGRMGAALNSVVEELNEKAKIAAAIAGGDLQPTIQVASEHDSLGKALDEMLGSLNQVVSQLNQAAEQVDSGSKQVADSSQSLSQGATEQAASLEEITSSMTEIGNQTKTNAESATQANQLATTAKNSGQKGIAQMDKMTSAMGKISESSSQIGNIIKTIDDIAFQTNLLALNAAVEAARAGKHGKGFAVVAQEVRNLAARSAKAAQETALLIEGAVKNVDDGTSIAEDTGKALQEINEGVTKVADLVNEIATASNEQALGISQVNQGLGQIDGVTQQNTANAEETSSAAVELSSQAESVRRLLSRFKLKHAAPGSQAPSPLSPDQQAAEWGPPPGIETIAHDQEGFEQEWQKQHAPVKKDHVVPPEQVIALDDEEFGKY